MKRLVAVTVVALALVGGACGGGDGEDARGVASVGGRQAAAGGDGKGGKPKATKEERERAALAFARCMRQNGIDMPDPGGDGAVMVRRGTPIGSREEMEKAEAACKKEREALQGTMGEPPADLQDKMLAMARCMRSKGIDMPDPTSSPNGATRVELGPDTMDEPKFMAAQEACRKEVGLPEPTFEGGSGPAGAEASR